MCARKNSSTKLYNIFSFFRLNVKKNLISMKFKEKKGRKSGILNPLRQLFRSNKNVYVAQGYNQNHEKSYN